MRILGIETTCDETGIAVLQAEHEDSREFRVPANAVASQIALHRPYGGVYPAVAKRAHQENLPLVLSRALKEAGLDPQSPEIDAVAIAHGPGLSPCLWTGITFAKELSSSWNVPLIPVNHMEGHLLVSLLWQGYENGPSPIPTFQIPDGKAFPVLGLIVSGGHTELVLSRKLGEYEVLGETVDDAAGEAFDKTARILGLPYPGGPEIAKIAGPAQPGLAIQLPRPMLRQKNYNFSFSGLKTAVLYDFQKRTEQERTSKAYVAAMAGEIQQAILDVLITKTMEAVREFQPRTVVLGGGVAANEELRGQLSSALRGVRLAAAPPALCTDNGSMIAVAGFVRSRLREGLAPGSTVEAKPDLRL